MSVQCRLLEPILTQDSNVFKQLEQMFGIGCFTRPLLQEHILSILQRHVQTCPDRSAGLDRVVRDGLAYVQDGKARIYEVAETLFTMALLCLKCDTDLHCKDLISRIIRLQMEAVSLVTEAGWPWTRQLSISRWFTFLSSAPEDRQMLSLYPGDETTDHVTALRYYLSGARDVIFRLPFRADGPVTPLPGDMQVPEGFALRDVHLYDFPIRRSQDNSTLTPLGLACQAVSPHVIAVLLQQGAAAVLFQAGLTETPLGQLTEPLAVLFRMLNKSRTWREWDIGGINEAMLESLQKQEQVLERSLIKCVSLLLRAVHNIPIQFYEKNDPTAIEKAQGFGKTKTGKDTFYLLGHYKHLIPTRRINCVGTLQHLCRLRVRSILRENRQLPDGIRELPVTWVLLPYLNLVE